MKSRTGLLILNRILVLTLLFGLVLLGSCEKAPDETPGKGKAVRPARATWTTGFFLEAIYSRALEDLGYTVEDAKNLANPIF